MFVYWWRILCCFIGLCVLFNSVVSVLHLWCFRLKLGVGIDCVAWLFAVCGCCLWFVYFDFVCMLLCCVFVVWFDCVVYALVVVVICSLLDTFGELNWLLYISLCYLFVFLFDRFGFVLSDVSVFNFVVVDFCFIWVLFGLVRVVWFC